jgi:hypothetical protein
MCGSAALRVYWAGMLAAGAASIGAQRWTGFQAGLLRHLGLI